MLSTNKIHQHTGEDVENKSLCVPFRKIQKLSQNHSEISGDVKKMSMIQSDHEKQWKCLDLRVAYHITREFSCVGKAFEFERDSFYYVSLKRECDMKLY